MRANRWMGRGTMEVAEVPDPQLLNRRDAIVRVTSTAICGSDLHMYDGYVPTMKKGDIVGHEFMGEVVEVGPDVRNLRAGDRVVVPFPIACGACWQCAHGQFSLCENSNPNAAVAEKIMGHSPAGIYGYSHMMGGFAGGQAEYARVPFADVGPIKIESDIADEKVLFLSDIFPTGYMAAEMCDIQPGDVVAVWGAGPVGQLAAASAFLLGAGTVVVIDRFPNRLEMVSVNTGAVPVNYEEENVGEVLADLTAGRGPDSVIDAVGMEAHHHVGVLNVYDKAKQATRAETDRPHALREAILHVRNGGVVSIAGVYAGFVDKFPLGAIMNRSLIIRSGQCHAQRYLRPLLDRILAGQIDPSFVISHRLPLAEAPHGYEIFRDKLEDCTKVVLTP